MSDYEDFLNTLSSIKSINSKQAKKILIDLLDNKKYSENYFSNLNESFNELKYCFKCNMITSEEDGICNICKNNKSDTLLIVKTHLEYFNLEKIIEFNNYNVIILNIKNQKELISFLNFNHTYEKLKLFLDENIRIKEVIFSFSHTNENLLLTNFIKEAFNHLNFYSLGKGLPSGNSVEYIDQETLKFAFDNKEKYE